MVKSRSKILMVIILTILMLVCVTSSVFADNTAIILPTNTTDNTAAATNDTNTENTTANVTANNTVTNNTTSILTSNNTVSQYNTTNTTALPKTGESDIYVVTALIAICGVSAIYAYKKIRDYNM
mgnify:CR=1 FL=1|jgi:biopolymer transport protein ExbD